MKNLKTIIFVQLFLILISNEICAQVNVNTRPSFSAYNLGYAHGAFWGASFEQMGLTKEEKNIDKFIEGFKAGLKTDAATFKTTTETITKLSSRKEPSTTSEQAEKVAFDVGLFSIAGWTTIEAGVLDTDFDLVAMKEGMAKFIAKDHSVKFNAAEIDSIFKAYYDPRRAYHESQKEGEKTIATLEALVEGSEFLLENKTKPGVITTASGLQYVVLQEGKGPKPKLSSNQVKMHYHGTFIDGSVFISSLDKNEPITTPMDNLLGGLKEGLQLMSVGAKYRLYLPHNLGFGPKSPSFGSALIFEVELLEILPKKGKKK